MDKNAIKKYAVWARRELISRVSQRAALYEITDNGFGDAATDSVLGRVMSAEEKHQRQALIAQIREKGYELYMVQPVYCPPVYGGQWLSSFPRSCFHG